MFVMCTGGLLHTEVCIGLDIAHFPSLMYGFIMLQDIINTHVCLLFTINAATPTQEEYSSHVNGDATPSSVLCLPDGGSTAACSAYIW